MGQQRLGRQAAGNDTVRCRSLYNRLAAAPAAVDRAPGDPDAEVQGHGVQTLGPASELRPDQLSDHQFQPLTLGIGLLEGALEVIALNFQSIERNSLPLNKGFHLDQPGLQLIWIGHVFEMTS